MSDKLLTGKQIFYLKSLQNKHTLKISHPTNIESSLCIIFELKLNIKQPKKWPIP